MIDPTIATGYARFWRSCPVIHRFICAYMLQCAGRATGRSARAITIQQIARCCRTGVNVFSGGFGAQCLISPRGCHSGPLDKHYRSPILELDPDGEIVAIHIEGYVDVLRSQTSIDRSLGRHPYRQRNGVITELLPIESNRVEHSSLIAIRLCSAAWAKSSLSSIRCGQLA
jgi:hypothetical protein